MLLCSIWRGAAPPASQPHGPKGQRGTRALSAGPKASLLQLRPSASQLGKSSKAAQEVRQNQATRSSAAQPSAVSTSLSLSSFFRSIQGAQTLSWGLLCVSVHLSTLPAPPGFPLQPGSSHVQTRASGS